MDRPHLDRIQLLEQVLVSYVERYGLTPEARLLLTTPRSSDTPRGERGTVPKPDSPAPLRLVRR